MITFSMLGNHGRLGNQLFQYALLRGVEAKTGHEAVVPRGVGNPHLLDRFSIPTARFRTTWVTRHKHRESRYYFDPSVFKVHDSTDFLGYYQTEKYFEHVASGLRQELVPSDKYMEAACRDHALYREMWDREIGQEYETVSVHIRRGDNAHGTPDQSLDEHAKYIPLQPLSYYRNALEHLRASVGKPLACVVFSNTKQDSEWCRQHFPIKHAVYRGGPEEDPLPDFATMLLCQHKIVSNSTLSWWAAWLSEPQGGRITFPTLWFGPAYAGAQWSTHDIMPPRWERISST